MPSCDDGLAYASMNSCCEDTEGMFHEVNRNDADEKVLSAYKDLSRQLETIFHASSDGIWVCDGEGKVINMNAASAKLNGCSEKQLIGKNIQELKAQGLFDRSVCLQVMASNKQISLVQHIKKTGKYLLTTGTPAFDQQGHIKLIVVNERDITQINAMREELEQTQLINAKMRDELAALCLMQNADEHFIAESPSMRKVLSLAIKLSTLDVSDILILGETGTGKGMLAEFIHKKSKRKDKAFIQINCAALPENLLEAELFGYEKGAFTGAGEQGKAGLIELAQKGTLFLDEIGELPIKLQAKLLKYLDDHEILRLGGTKARHIECTLISATNQDLATLSQTGHFRNDLFHRLNVFTIQIPPLRNRSEDLFAMAKYFLSHYNDKYGSGKQLGAKGLAKLQAYDYPGNVRELKNIVKRAVIVSEKQFVDDFIFDALAAGNCGLKKFNSFRSANKTLKKELQEFERDILLDAMQKCKTTREIADLLGISQPSVVRKLKMHRLS